MLTGQIRSPSQAPAEVLSGVASSQLARKTLLTMALRVAFVVLTSAIFSYFYLIQHVEVQVKERLERSAVQRSQQAAVMFRLAQDRHQILKQRLLEQLGQSPNGTTAKAAERKFSPLPLQPFRLELWSDRTRRNFPEHYPLDEFDGEHQASIILGRGAQLTSELKQRLQIFQQLVSQYGPAWRDRFTNTYISAPENAAVVYWPEVPGPLMVPGEFDVHEEPFFYLSDRGHNPQRRTAWTAVYQDPASPDLIISIVTPVDSPDGRHLATIGHDIILTELIEQANRDRIKGTQNLIFSADGQLIVHPQLSAEIRAQAGKLNIRDIADPHLNEIFQQVVAQDALNQDVLNPAALSREIQVEAGLTVNPASVVESKSEAAFLAISRIEGPGWYLVTVYPKALLNEEAIAAAQFVLLSGLLTLSIELTLLRKVLQNEVIQPLGQLVQATEKLAQRSFRGKALEDNRGELLQQREDEIGQLSRAFVKMAGQLEDTFVHLESRIADRTAQLQAANQELERLSLVDELTQLANRRCFDATLEQELKREQQPLSLLLCDIDYFKRYNDHYGHPAGDECLKAIAGSLKAIACRPMDLAARYGGEEFALILPAMNMDAAVKLGQRLCNHVRQAQLPHDDSPISAWVTLSLGVATYSPLSKMPLPEVGAAGESCSGESLSPLCHQAKHHDQTKLRDQASSLIAAADQALYMAKRAGRNQVAAAQSCANGGEVTMATTI